MTNNLAIFDQEIKAGNRGVFSLREIDRQANYLEAD
jgi:hypothetical protein